MPIKIEDTISMDGVDSLSGDDISNGGTRDSHPLKKGPWTSAEDTLLVDYVTKHGEGNWNSIQKHSGLARCGKSCRLRWSNHLRPDLKKGAFTPDEERCIIELHAKIGNKWARMAAELPGRTDNEIKNYWNTRIKRRQRAGLPIYPPGVCFQTLNVSPHDEEVSRFRSGNPQRHDRFPVNNFEISAVDFKYLEYNQQIYSSAFTDIPADSLLDIPAYPLPAQGLSFSSMHPFKRLRASDHPFHLSSAYSTGAVLPSSQYYDDSSVIGQSYGIFSVYDHDHDPDYPSPSCTLPGSHALLNGNFSPSESTPLTMKLGLPSLQSQMGIWGSSASPLPSLKSVDTLIRSPLTEQTASGSLSPRNSGLLDAVLHESKTIKNNSIQQTSADVNPAHSMNDSSQDPHENGDPTSPLGHSVSLVFNELKPKSVDYTCECESFDAIQGHAKQEAQELPKLQSNIEKETSDDLIFSSPDVFLSCWQFSA